MQKENSNQLVRISVKIPIKLKEQLEQQYQNEREKGRRYKEEFFGKWIGNNNQNFQSQPDNAEILNAMSDEIDLLKLENKDLRKIYGITKSVTQTADKVATENKTLKSKIKKFKFGLAILGFFALLLGFIGFRLKNKLKQWQ